MRLPMNPLASGKVYPAYPRRRVLLRLCGVPLLLAAIAVFVVVLVSIFVCPVWLNGEGEMPMVRSWVRHGELVPMALTLFPVIASLLLTLPEFALGAALAAFLKLRRNPGNCLMLTGLFFAANVLKGAWMAGGRKGAFLTLVADIWPYFPAHAALCFLVCWYGLPPGHAMQPK